MLLEELSVNIKRARSSKAEWTSRRLSAHISACGCSKLLFTPIIRVTSCTADTGKRKLQIIFSTSGLISLNDLCLRKLKVNQFQLIIAFY
jgi:hypothetical protein